MRYPHLLLVVCLAGVLLGVAHGEDARLAVPDTATRQAHRHRLTQLFADAYRSNDPQAKQQLAADLAAVARDTRDPALRYVLLSETLRIAADIADIPALTGAAKALGKDYQVDRITVELDALTATGRRVATAEQAGALVSAAIALNELAVGHNDYSRAIRAARLGTAAAARTDDPALRERAQRVMLDTRRQQREFARIASSLETLADNPDDPAANRRVGLYHAFQKSNWPVALPLLAKADDEKLAAMAKAELAAPDNAEAIKQLGDQWWQWGEGQAGALESAARQRAVHWYRQCQNDLPALERVRIANRIAQYHTTANTEAAVKGDVALASRGAKAIAEQNAEALIDGDTTKFTAQTGFARGKWPCEMVVQLDKVYPLRQIHILFWDRDDRSMQYAVDTSIDGKNWQLLVDRSKGQWRSWQVIPFKTRPARYIRLRGLHNSLFDSVAVVEIEAYCQPPADPPTPSRPSTPE